MLRTPKVSRSEIFRGFDSELISRLRLTEVSVLPKAEEPDKLEGRVVFEVTVDEEMLNSNGSIHGGITAMIIDEHVSSTHVRWQVNDCSTMPIYVLGLATGGRATGGVTHSLNVVYHSPALLGDKLRVVSTTLTLGNRALSSRCEIWNATRHRLVASAVHLKMDPSEPKPSAKL
ncbi:hypothetical protein K503DRAFT_731781 [Rhizopogon vinicolor AM-OR11-026]|uniref:Thioesterase domain-containing protein n=1 Tax=Rhizopogon vinicolor AM-OR11-026 TaxID=1314800 RepID=A0A1B7NEQ1_9AGAM|nr:hypothetical protein K503DRAFT_731781 [Rhizopogon vinicolor AM-OR11-026]